jgi:hypothetical protein
MTTVTEAAKRLVGGDDEADIRSGNLEKICADPVLAQRLGRRLAEAARDISPGREWSLEDLRDVLEVAVRGPREEGVRVLEGRYFRKRLRDQCALAQRYGDPFSCVVFTLVRGQVEGGGMYTSVLDAITERLRRSDMVFLYRRRFAMILPRMRAESLGQLVGRITELVSEAHAGTVLETVQCLSYPDPVIQDTQSMLDWAEDRLRDI